MGRESSRIKREQKTIEAIMGIYCAGHHGKGGTRCSLSFISLTVSQTAEPKTAGK